MSSVNIDTEEVRAAMRDEIADQPYPLLFATISGAHLYGFPSSDSDIDLRGVHVLPLPAIVGLATGRETIEAQVVRAGILIETVTHDVKKFIRLLLKRNGYVLEQLYSPLIVKSGSEHEELKALAAGCITRNHSFHYLGFAENQWKLLQKSPTVKIALYLYRVLLTGIHLMQTGEIEANLVRLNEIYRVLEIPDLIQAKVGGLEKSRLNQDELSVHETQYLRLADVLRREADRSRLPESPSTESALNDFLVRTRLHSVGGAP